MPLRAGISTVAVYRADPINRGREIKRYLPSPILVMGSFICGVPCRGSHGSAHSGAGSETAAEHMSQHPGPGPAAEPVPKALQPQVRELLTTPSSTPWSRCRGVVWPWRQCWLVQEARSTAHCRVCSTTAGSVVSGPCRNRPTGWSGVDSRAEGESMRDHVASNPLLAFAQARFTAEEQCACASGSRCDYGSPRFTGREGVAG
jgi:hypothetical protein